MAEENKELKNYTRIFNPILEALSLHTKNLSSAEYSVILCVIRSTYGWKQKSHPMSKTLIMQKTGLSEPTVKRTLKSLIDRHYLIDYGIDKKTKCKVIGLNKKYSQWNAEGVIYDRVNPDPQGGSNLIPQGGSNLIQEGVTDEPQYRYHSKDTLSKERKSKDTVPKKTFFLSSSGVPYVEMDDEYGYWRETDGTIKREPISEGKEVKKD